MKSLKRIQLSLKTSHSVKTITSAYQELARIKMLEIRDFVLQNRAFIEELAKVYYRIKKGGLKQAKLEILPKVSKPVIVLLSSNQMFYGPLLLSLWYKFIEYIKSTPNPEIVIVGKIAKNWIKQEFPQKHFVYFDLSDENPSAEEARKILEAIKHYKKIIVIHGRFVNSFVQTASAVDITEQIPPPTEELITQETYLFEPSFRAVLEFFETEMLASLFNQIIWEHQLAKFAARMIAMYQATENAQELIHKLEHQLQKEKRKLFNKKQIVLIDSFQAWIKTQQK